MLMPKNANLLLLGALTNSRQWEPDLQRYICTVTTSTAHNCCLLRRDLNRGNVLECFCSEKPNIYPGHLQESFSGGSAPSEPLQATLLGSLTPWFPKAYVASVSWLGLCGPWPSALKRIGLQKTAATGAAWKGKAVSTPIARQDTKGLVVTELGLHPLGWGLGPGLSARQEGCFCGESILAGASIIPAVSAPLYLDVTFWSKYNDHAGSILWTQIIFWLCLPSLTQTLTLQRTPKTHDSKSTVSFNFFITGWCTFVSLKNFKRLIQDHRALSQ